MKKVFYILFSVLIVVAICFSIVGCDSNVKIVVRFDSNGGSEFNSVEYVLGEEQIKLPDDPTKEGFVFDGWYEDNEVFENPFVFESVLNSKIKEDKVITLYAKWIPEINIKFESNGGSECNNLLITQLQFVLPTPVKSDYDFAGWYLDNYTFLQKFEEDSLEDLNQSEITLYAKWDKIPLSNLKKTVYYVSNYNLSKNYEIFTDKLDLFQPYIIGKYFDGWYFEDTFSNKAPDTLTKEMFNFGRNYVYLYAKFITKEVYSINLLGEVKLDYNENEAFDANDAKLYVSYLDKNFKDEMFSINSSLISGFYTQINAESLNYLLKVSDNVYKGIVKIGLNDKYVELDYYVHLNTLVV